MQPLPDNPIELIKRYKEARYTAGRMDSVYKNLLGRGRMEGEASAFRTCLEVLEGDKSTIINMLRYITDVEQSWEKTQSGVINT